MTDKLKLAIVILNYKTPELVIQCLDSIAPQLVDGFVVEIVDNNSQDDSEAIISEWIAANPLSPVRLTLSNENLGFSGGNNLGVKQQEAEHYLLVNSDTILRPEAIATMLTAINNDSSIGIVGPRLEWENGEPQISCFRFHNPISEFIKAASTGLFTSFLKNWDVPIELSNKMIYPEWISFACVLIRSEALKDVGLMDDGYFLYYEDADFCRMAKAKAWKVAYEPAAKVVHLRGGSSDVKKNTSQKKRLPDYVYASRSRYFAKHYTVFGLLLANILWSVGRSIAVIREAMGKTRYSSCEKQATDIWTNFFDPLNSNKNGKRP